MVLDALPNINRPTTRRPARELLTVATNLLRAAGCEEEAAKVAAEIFVEADLRGVGLQGIDYLPLMVRALQSGRIKSEAVPTVTREGDSFLLVDGNGGVGQHAAIFTIDRMLIKAQQTGCCVAGLYDASELYILGYYAERIARAGYIGLIFTTWAPLVHPWGGMDAILGTNPLSISFPTLERDPVVIDMATSALANGRIRQAAYHDETVPMGTGIGEDGLPTVIAKEIQRGAISPLGPKGYGLSLAIALLCGPLVGADIGKALASLKGGDPSEAKLGHFFIVIDPSAILGDDTFPSGVSSFLKEIRSSRPAPGYQSIRIPGDRTFDQRWTSIDQGVEVLNATWTIIQNLAKEFNVDVPP